MHRIICILELFNAKFTKPLNMILLEVQDNKSKIHKALCLGQIPIIIIVKIVNSYSQVIAKTLIFEVLRIS